MRSPLRPLSCENEAAVLRQLAAACAAQLAAYPTSLAEDLATLAAGVHAPGSNRRNALVLLRGEKLVCEHYVGLARAALPYLDAPARGAGPAAAADARTALARAHAGTSDADKYMRNVVLPLLRRREDGLTAGGPVGPGGVAPPPVPVRARFHAAGAGAGGGDGAGAAVA